MNVATGTRRPARVGMAAAATVVGVLAISLTVIIPTLAALLGATAVLLGWLAGPEMSTWKGALAVLGMTLGAIVVVAVVLLVIFLGGGSSSGVENVTIPPPSL